MLLFKNYNKMKNTKLFSFIGIFTFLILTLSLASAASLTITDIVIPSDVLEDEGSFDITFDIENTGADTTVDYSASSLTEGTGSISIPDTDLLTGEKKSVTATVTFDADQTGNIAGTVIADPSGVGDSKDFTFSVAITQITEESFCENGSIDDNGLTLNIDLKNKGKGEDDNEWLPLDRIEVEVELDNDWGDKLDNIIFELGLFAEGSSTNIIDDMFWISEDNEEVKVGDIKDGKKESYTFIFRVDPEIEEGDYILKVKAYPKGDEDIQCIDYSNDLEDFGPEDTYAEISVSREDVNDGRAVIVDIEELDVPYDVICGQTVMLVADIYNIADEDQDQVKVTLKNSELGIDLVKEIREDLDMGEKDEVTFSFEVPETAEEKEYILELRTYYDYDDDDGTYDETSDTFTKHIKVTGSCIGTEPTITATLLSDAKVGEDLVVQVTVTNNGKSSENFVVAVEGAETWAEVVDVSPQILTISKGSADTAVITLKPTKAGTQTFDITLIYSGEEASQSVSVSIEDKSGFMTGAFSGLGLDDSGLYVVAGIFLVLIIIILVLIVKIAKAPKTAEF